MDSVTEKFSVFDFFNLIIAGMVFIIVLGICHYPQSKDLIVKILKFDNDSFLFQTGIMVVFLCEALIIGMILQVVADYIIKEKIGWERKVIGYELITGKLFKNKIRTDSIIKKARRYLNISGDTNLDAEKCEAFFSYCVYYLQIKGFNKKTEKLYETQGLSELLTCTFFAVPLSSICILFIQKFIFNMGNLSFDFVKNIYIVSILLGIIFYCRYKLAGRNRIRMILSIYDICTETEEKNNKKINEINW